MLSPSAGRDSSLSKSDLTELGRTGSNLHNDAGSDIIPVSRESGSFEGSFVGDVDIGMNGSRGNVSSASDTDNRSNAFPSTFHHI